MKESYVFLPYLLLFVVWNTSVYKKKEQCLKKPTKKYEENQVFLNSTLFNLKSQNFWKKNPWK